MLKLVSILAALFMLLLPLCAEAGEQKLKPSVTVLSGTVFPSLTRLFVRDSGWTGADSAYSIQLKKGLTLWMFGDTWIGPIKKGNRVDSTMINNTAAWQYVNDHQKPLRFFYKNNGHKAASLIESDRADTWIWPGDGALINGKLYLFLHLIRRTPNEGWGFAIAGHEIVRIDNPLDEPTLWHMKRKELPSGKSDMQFGNACLDDGDYLYAYGSYPPQERGSEKHPLVVARIDKRKLEQLDMSAWEYWCCGSNKDNPAQNRWSVKPVKPVILFRDGAPEMTVSTVRGINGFVATYLPAGFGSDIVIRHAESPEGPWSNRVTAYHCPEDTKRVLLYSAKAHPELSTKNGELVITYCRNHYRFEQHITEPLIYVPQGVVVRLKQSGRVKSH